MPGPGHPPDDRSLRIILNPSRPLGFWVRPWNSESWQAGQDHICDQLGIPRWESNAPRRRCSVRPIVEPNINDHRQRQGEKASWLWTQSSPAQDTVVEHYLSRARGINLVCIPTTLRYLAPRPPRYPHPTMIAPFALPTEPEPGKLAVSRQAISGVHLTKLKSDGSGKADVPKEKRMLGICMGTPIVLAPLNDNLGLAITEGIEDALSIHVATGLGAWAAGSAPFMPALANVVPSYCEIVTIIADANDAGQDNADLLADRLVQRGISVTVLTPGQAGIAA